MKTYTINLMDTDKPRTCSEEDYDDNITGVCIKLSENKYNSVTSIFYPWHKIRSIYIEDTED